ncbi:MAG: type II toxin-antitoxin system VapC family toxin [Verrucomicrobia bacterium]|nr:type II toxin-antitoxin system VapC family toxin [Verrucomicrobiota bacterium]
MKTAIDSSALLAIFNGEPEARAWLECLIRARREGQLVLCEIVCPELAPAFSTQTGLDTALDKLGVRFEPSSTAVA